MSLVRLGDICTGHDDYPSRPNIEAVSNVFCNGLGIHCIGHRWDIHCNNHDCHDAITVQGSDKVFINGISAARVGDQVSCGSKIKGGSPNVISG